MSSQPITPAAIDELMAICHHLFELLAAAEQGWLIRDVHSPNILWQDEESGTARAAFIDYQDALLGPTAYDVASMCFDARLDISREIELGLLDHYLAARHRLLPAFDADKFRQAYLVCGIQRMLKILGIFIRFDIRDQKPGYRRHLPRIQNYMRRLLEQKETTALRQWLATYTPNGLTD